ncbi:hypothetical protein L1049_023257 [Liquidambar formosana]|uniref:Uncharacterized protein n=1 Tax=Liquidambar formosana TaxID=63359 RepID=A0AAP0WRM5_LIQFO
MEGSAEETAKAVSDLSMDASSPSEPTASEETLSKNARKREAKIKQKEEERRRKEEDKARQTAAMANSKVQRPQAADDDDMDPTQYFENRLKAIATQKEAGKNPYPHKFFVSMSIVKYVEKYGSLDNGAHVEDDTISLAGRIMTKRSSSSKAVLL